MSIRRVGQAAAIAIAALSCSSSSPSGPVTNPLELSITTPQFTVPPGDSFECFYMNMTTDRELSVNDSFGQQGPGGHHIVVYYIDQPHPEEHHPCIDAEMVNWHQIAGSGGQDGKSGEGIIGLPPGFAIKVPPGKQLVVQAHYINVTGKDMQVQDTVTLKMLDPKDVKYYANALVLVDDQFDPPPHATHTRTSTCTLKRDYQMVIALGHMHELGQHYLLEQLDAQGNLMTNLYEKSWQPSFASHPPINRYTGDAPL